MLNLLHMHEVNQMVKTKWQSVLIEADVKKKLQDIAKITGKSQGFIISEIIEPLHSLLLMYNPNSKPVGYWIDYLMKDSKIQLTVYGRERMLTIKTNKVTQNE